MDGHELYKRLAKIKVDDHFTDEEILTKVHLPSPSELLRRARLRYFATLVKAEHEDIWTLLARDSAWRQLLEDDMIWMWNQLHHTSDLRDPRSTYPQWLLIVQTSPKYWKNLVKRACAHSINNVSEYCTFKIFIVVLYVSSGVFSAGASSTRFGAAADP